MTIESSKRAIGGLNSLARMRGDMQAVPTRSVASPDEALVTTKLDLPLPVEEYQVIVPEVSPKKRQMKKKIPDVSSEIQRPVAHVEGSPTEKMTIYIPRVIRERAKAAFRATQNLEGDGSFSQFITTAISREIERREQIHNSGEQYRGTGDRLTSGRPLT